MNAHPDTAPDITLSPDRPFDRLFDFLAWGILAVVAVIAALTFRDYGLGWDDYTHSQYADLLLDFYSSGFKDMRAFSFVNLYLYGGGFDMAAALLAKVLHFDLFETRRLAGAMIGLIGLAITWRIGRRIGGPLAGLLALALLASCPLFYGHMFINSKDAPFATTMLVLLLGLLRVLQDYPKPRVSTGLILALGLGLSVGTRIMAGFGIVEALAALALLVALEARGVGLKAASARAGRCLLTLIPYFVLAYAIMAVIWPWAVFHFENPFRAIGYFAHFFETPWRELYEGSLIPVPDMPRRYVLVLLGLKLPVLFVLLSVAGLVGTAAMMLRRDIAQRDRAALLCIALAAVLPIAVTVITRPAMYNGVRHFVFVVPPLALLGGLAGGWMLTRLRRTGRAGLAAGAAVLAAGMALPVVAMARLHPYEYAHFNEIAGGARGAESRFMLDYWGLAFKQAGRRFLSVLAERHETPPAGRKWKVAVCGPHPPAEVVLGDQFDVTWDPKDADFAMMLGTFYCANYDAPVLVEIKRDGLVFARVYDIRGRTFQSVFKYPPEPEPDHHELPPQ